LIFITLHGWRAQSILASYDEDNVPPDATMSREADVAFWDDPDNTISDTLDGAIGEMSQFDSTFGYYAQGVSNAFRDSV
jgi:hypothetical protein